MENNKSLRKSLLGYASRLTVRPTEKIEFKVSSKDDLPYDAQLVRLVNGDIYFSNGSQYKEIEVESTINDRYPGREQAIVAGSYIVIDDIPTVSKCRN